MDRAAFATDATKWLVKSIIAAKVADLAANTITDHTRFDKDSIAVKLGSGAIGVMVSSQVDPLTDKIVDKTANFIKVKLADRRTKKNDKKSEK